ncbi:MAG: hypothetical protein HYZ28_00060 [Myxococcales bacterium]|nr:hypothetical protein [Myxococcales bacterium]
MGLRFWLEAEQGRVTREVDERLIDKGDLEAVDPRFLPEGGRVFRLPSHWVDVRELHLTELGLLRAGLRRRLLRRTSAGKQVLFLTHPLALARSRFLQGAEPGPPLYAAATASTRTVLVWSEKGGPPPFFAKLSIAGEFAGASREVSATEAATCVGVSRLLGEVQRGRGLVLLFETMSAVPRGEETGGFIVRELPPSVLRGGSVLVPWFALTNASRDGGEPMLWAMARRSGAALLRFVGERLFRPFLRAFLESALSEGWVAEVHAQNLLVELDARLGPTGRFFLRDAEGIYADLAFIERIHPSGAKAVRSLPFVRNLADDYEELELTRGLEASLHGYFLGGPIYRLERSARPPLGRGAFRRLFFEELKARMRAASGREVPGAALTPAGFAEWIEEERFRRLKRPRLPGGLSRWIEREQSTNRMERDPLLFAPVDFSGLPERFHPASRPVWRLEYLAIPRRQLELTAGRLPRAIRRGLFFRRGGREHVRFFLHPLMRQHHLLDVAEHGLERGTFWATPTASLRTVAVWDAADPSVRFGLKLSVDAEIHGINRVVKASKLARATAVSEAFDAIPGRTRRRHGFEVLREPLALRTEDKAFGTIVRELAPRMDRLVPGFSLFAAPERGRAPLAIALAGRRAGAEGLVRWLEARVLGPLARACAYLMFQEGLLGDLHQQNVLFEQTGSGALSGKLVLRDLDSFKTDLDLRFRRGRTLRPYARHPGPSDDLKLDEAFRHYDEAWGRELRAEWAFLCRRLFEQWASVLGGRRAVRRALAGGRLWAALDRTFLESATEHLGEEVVLAELRRVLQARKNAEARRLHRLLDTPEGASLGARELLRRIPSPLLVDPRTPSLPLYSANAMVRAWKRVEPAPCRARGPPSSRQTELRRRFLTLASEGRSIFGGQPPPGARFTAADGVLVAWGADGRPADYALSQTKPLARR